MAKFKLDDIKYASVVVVGRIVNYEALKNHARFNVLVDEVLVGHPPAVISATWVNSTFKVPMTIKEGPYLIGFCEPGPNAPPSNAFIPPSQERNTLTVLQADCAPAFILDALSAEAITIRKMLAPPSKDRKETQRKKGPSILGGIDTSSGDGKREITGTQYRLNLDKENNRYCIPRYLQFLEQKR